ncbi:YebC/PmpR family DNA-binding transcriptional regulator [Egicoccus sp. AB-alg6-2]|uniref:YebC/PmpR family DNA-binding transcriptional regulator n=1 Tax=Egicoccus sp. AB-alg6-2 TaxID=3242692 RepID=UPI00359E23C2
MSGHSKWSTIKHKKAAKDARRGKQWAKLIRQIEVAAREAGTADTDASPSLALAVQKAKDAEVPKDTIERACKRGAGELDGASTYEATQYEGYAPGGVAVLVDCLTDNRNRTASDIRSAFSKSGGNLAEPGSVSFLFSRRGQVLVEANGHSEDDLMLVGLDAGLEDLEHEGEQYTAWCDPSDVPGLRKAFEDGGFTIVQAGSTMVPASVVPIAEAAEARKVLRLLDTLDDNDDVQDVYANFDIPEDLIDSIED